jgi:hypothetical protein
LIRPFKKYPLSIMDAHIFPFYANYSGLFYIEFGLMLMYGPVNVPVNGSFSDCTYLYLVDLKTNQWLNLNITGGDSFGFTYPGATQTFPSCSGNDDNSVFIIKNMMHIFVRWNRHAKLTIYSINLLNLRDKVNKLDVNMRFVPNMQGGRCFLSDNCILFSGDGFRPFILDLKKAQIVKVFDFATDAFYSGDGIIYMYAFDRGTWIMSNFTLYDYVNDKIIYKVDQPDRDNVIIGGPVLMAYTADHAAHTTKIYTRKKRPDE